MTFTIPEFWCGFIAGVVVLFLVAVAIGKTQGKRGEK